MTTTFPQNLPNCIPTTHVCSGCGSLYTCYGDNDGRCPRRACSATAPRHADLTGVPVPCWGPSCTASPKHVIEWVHRSQGARRECACSAHFAALADYSEDTSDGFSLPTFDRFPSDAGFAVAA